MQTLTVDPMTGNEVTDLENAFCIVDGVGEDAIKIYFESEVSYNEFIEFRKAEEPARDSTYEKIAS